jgi:hypothetical protein
MKTNINNILSYFIKDIKDPKELAFYTGIKTNINIQIFYKDELIYEIKFFPFKYICNCKKNTIQTNYSFNNYKVYSDKHYKFKYLSYKNDNNIAKFNPNYIWYSYKQNKYLNKTNIKYIYNSKNLIIFILHYYKESKYIFKIKAVFYKFNSSLILIVNKYELHYYNRFFNLYFDRLD